MVIETLSYTERFVQEDGERWRIFQDADECISIEYQVWAPATRVWWVDPNIDPSLKFPPHIAKKVGLQILELVKEIENA